MGHWKITIDGHGIHHNKRPDDANVMTADFIAALRKAGHEVLSAEFALTGAGGEDLTAEPAPAPEG